MQNITGTPPVVADAVFVIFNTLFSIWVFLTWDGIWFFAPLFFTILSVTNLVRTLNSGITVNDTGVSCKIKKQQFQLAYHEISAVSIADADNRKTLLIVSGYQSHSIRIKNANAVCAAIVHNMTVLGTTPAPLPTPAQGGIAPTLSQKINRTRKWILIIFLASMATFIPFGVGVPLPFASLIAYFVSDLFGLFFGLLIVTLYFVLWLLSKNRHFMIVVALIFVALETFWATYIGIISDGLFVFLFAYIFPNLWILFRLACGTSAWKKLRSIPCDELNTPSDILSSPNDVLYTGEQLEDPQFYIDDAHRNHILDIYARERSTLPETFYAFDNIPSKKLENAKKSYATSLSGDEQVIFLYDDTIIGSAKSGFILTSKCLYNKSDATGAAKSYIKNIARITQATATKIRYAITIEMTTGSYTDFIVAAPQEKRTAIVCTLDKTIGLLKSHLSV